MLLADDLYFVAHEETSGKSRLHPRVTGLALAAALLGELVMDGKIDLRAGMITIIDRQPPVDALAHTILDQLASERQQHATHNWLAFLGNSATDQVCQRMVRSGHLNRSESRGLLRTTVRFVPADRSAAAWPEARLRRFLTRGEQLTIQDAVLAGLIEASDLTRHVLWDGDARSFQYLAWVLSSLPPPLRELVTQAQAAIGNAVITTLN
ncbi:GOLPH3/VPS74 family protein [Luedemannella helvata]|uniref:GPP34 family phosphoprotein n=1 Tax=Luedemannella helvata TaxID=349315 RepID=A0ABN2JZ02_9ACTN